MIVPGWSLWFLSMCKNSTSSLSAEPSQIFGDPHNSSKAPATSPSLLIVALLTYHSNRPWSGFSLSLKEPIQENQWISYYCMILTLDKMHDNYNYSSCQSYIFSVQASTTLGLEEKIGRIPKLVSSLFVIKNMSNMYKNILYIFK